MMRILGLVLLILVAAGCEDNDDDQQPVASKFLFLIRGVPEAEGRFVAITSDTAVIRVAREELAKPVDERRLFPSGPIERGTTENYSWSWYFVENEWTLTEAAIELCDGTPLLIESDLDYWIDTVGTFCPWGAYVVDEVRPAD